MERKEEIEKRILELATSNFPQCVDWASFTAGYEEGIEWADEHPKTLYVITRSEEHSDYVEKVFVDKKKAEEYCRKFEGNEDEYGRDITEINVTL